MHCLNARNFVRSLLLPPISCQLALDQALYTIKRSPYLRDLETNWCDQLVPLLRRTFLCSKVHHHDDVQGSRLPMSSGVGDNVLVNENLAVSGRHRSDELGENPLACFVVPVVENGVQEICPSVWKKARILVVVRAIIYGERTHLSRAAQ